MENLILYDLVISQKNILNDFLVAKGFVPKVEVKKDPDADLLCIEFDKSNHSVWIYMIFCGINYYKEETNSFGISIWQPNLKESHGIDLDKFVQKHPDLGSIEMFSLNYYTGTIEEKIRSCFEFIVKVLSHPELLRVYEGDYYTNEYYKPWYEGNNLD